MSYYLQGIDQTFCQSVEAGQHVIGRSSQAAIIIDHPSVSSNHAEIDLKTDGVVTIRDLGSTNGTFVGSEKISEATLDLGNEFMLGDVRLKFDTQPVQVTVPEVEIPKRLEPSWLPDGRSACLRHPDSLALHLCSQCGHTLCDACVRRLGLKGGRPKVFCELCSGPCRPIGDDGRGREKSSKIKAVLESIKRFFGE